MPSALDQSRRILMGGFPGAASAWDVHGAGVLPLGPFGSIAKSTLEPGFHKEQECLGGVVFHNDGPVRLIGGVARQAGLVEARRRRFDGPVIVPDEPDEVAALGAAVLGLRRVAPLTGQPR